METYLGEFLGVSLFVFFSVIALDNLASNGTRESCGDAAKCSAAA